MCSKCCCGSQSCLTTLQRGGAVYLANGEAFTAINSTFFNNSVRRAVPRTAGSYSSLFLRRLLTAVLSMLPATLVFSFSVTGS